ncbi:MAG: hypothetical protein WD044_03080 [Dongiaceae bacterium]
MVARRMVDARRASLCVALSAALLLWRSADAGAAECRYDVVPGDAVATEIHITIDCDGGLPERFVMRNGAGAAWAGDMTLADGSSIAPEDAGWTVPADRRAGSLTYSVPLRAMAEANRSYEVALASGGSVLASPDAWLAVPEPAGDWTLAIAFEPPDDGDVATALPRSHGRHRIAARSIARTGPIVFGQFYRLSMTMPAPNALDRGDGATTSIDLVILDGVDEADALAWAGWVDRSGHAVAEFWRGFPVERPLVVLVPVEGVGVPYGRVVSVGGLAAMILVGKETPAADLYQDWVLIHELLHLGTPYARDTGPWLNEGIATLYEPVVRARAGWKSTDEVWREWIEWMPNGLRTLGPVGLEEARGGGVYWGGALFLLLAEIEVRERTGLRLGVEDCLRAVRNEGGTIGEIWPTAKILERCDAALGGSTLADLAARHLGPGEPPDLAALWGRLGVSLNPDGSIAYDDAAPLAAVRDAILSGGPEARWAPVPIGEP